MLTTASILIPLVLGSVSIALRDGIDAWLATLLTFCGVMAILSLVGCVVAVLRVRSIRASFVPYVDAIIDGDSHVTSVYSSRRDSLTLLRCALKNNAIIDLRYDFLRAGQSLLVLALVFLLVLGVAILITQWTEVGKEPVHETTIPFALSIRGPVGGALPSDDSSSSPPVKEIPLSSDQTSLSIAEGDAESSTHESRQQIP